MSDIGERAATRSTTRAFALALVWIAGAIWTLPNTVIGLLMGLPALAFGAKLRVGDAALVFVDYPWGPGGALALGNSILCTHASLDCQCRTYAERHGMAPAGGLQHRLGDHERAHVFQAMALGIFFLPMYLLCGGISARNRFEQTADRYAQTGQGWWPWSSSG
ncbi:MAG: hypothetical protein ABIQ97_05225 [Lysobacteraceae bacterium]